MSRKSLSFLTYYFLIIPEITALPPPSAPFRRLSSASASQSWYVRHVRYLALEVVKENIPDSSAVVDYNPLTTIFHNIYLSLPTGSRFILIGVNRSGKSTLLWILGGRHLTPPDSDVQRRLWQDLQAAYVFSPRGEGRGGISSRLGSVICRGV